MRPKTSIRGKAFTITAGPESLIGREVVTTVVKIPTNLQIKAAKPQFQFRTDGVLLSSCDGKIHRAPSANPALWITQNGEDDVTVTQRTPVPAGRPTAPRRQAKTPAAPGLALCRGENHNRAWKLTDASVAFMQVAALKNWMF